MATRRNTRVSEVVRKELSNLLVRCHDFEGKLVTISEVSISPDLKNAFVYFSILNPSPTDRNMVMEALENRRLEWQGAVGKKLKAKYIPLFTFKFDDSIERGDRVMEIMRQIEEDDAKRRNNKHTGRP